MKIISKERQFYERISPQDKAWREKHTSLSHSGEEFRYAVADKAEHGWQVL